MFFCFVFSVQITGEDEVKETHVTAALVLLWLRGMCESLLHKHNCAFCSSNHTLCFLLFLK